MVYFHPGKVLEIFSPKDKYIETADSSIQAVVETWDENIITYLVDSKLADKIKVGDIVLIDYNPTKDKPTRPKMVICKILYGEKAKKTWKAYKEYLKKRPKIKRATPAQAIKPPYIG
jgi:hypothetical protein